VSAAGFDFAVDVRALKTWLGLFAPFASGGYGRRRNCLPEVRIRADPDGLRAVLVSGDHTYMADVTLGSASLVGYSGSGAELGFDLAKLAEFAKVARPAAAVRIRFDAAEDRVYLTTGNVTRTCATLDVEGVVWPKVPQLTPATRAVVPAAALAAAVDGSCRVSDHAFLATDGENVTVAGSGESDDCAAHLTAEAARGAGKSLYPLDTLSAVLKALKRAGDLSLEWGDDYPLRLSFRFAGRDAGVAGSYILAPRIDRDEEPSPEPAEEVGPSDQEPADDVSLPEPEPEPDVSGPEPATAEGDGAPVGPEPEVASARAEGAGPTGDREYERWAAALVARAIAPPAEPSSVPQEAAPQAPDGAPAEPEAPAQTSRPGTPRGRLTRPFKSGWRTPRPHRRALGQVQAVQVRSARPARQGPAPAGRSGARADGGRTEGAESFDETLRRALLLSHGRRAA